MGLLPFTDIIALTSDNTLLLYVSLDLLFLLVVSIVFLLDLKRVDTIFLDMPFVCLQSCTAQSLLSHRFLTSEQCEKFIMGRSLAWVYIAYIEKLKFLVENLV